MRVINFYSTLLWKRLKGSVVQQIQAAANLVIGLMTILGLMWQDSFLSMKFRSHQLLKAFGSFEQEGEAVASQ